MTLNISSSVCTVFGLDKKLPQPTMILAFICSPFSPLLVKVASSPFCGALHNVNFVDCLPLSLHRRQKHLFSCQLVDGSLLECYPLSAKEGVTSLARLSTCRSYFQSIALAAEAPSPPQTHHTQQQLSQTQAIFTPSSCGVLVLEQALL